MYFLGFGFITGILLGSFVKAIADRSLKGRSFWGRSYCPGCKHILPWYDLLPVFSYIFLDGKCRFCRKAIGTQYVLVEIVMGILVGFLFWQASGSLQSVLELIFKTFFITVLSILFLTDIKKMFIPDRVVIPAINISIIFLFFITLIKIGYLYYYLSQTTLGKLLLPPHSTYFQRHALMAAEPLFWGILMGILIGSFFTALIIITKGKGMGGGDVKLGALMGIVLGFPNSVLALMLAFFIGAIFSVVLILVGKKHFKSVVPFGPFLVLGSLVALFWGNWIVDWYLKLGT